MRFASVLPLLFALLASLPTSAVASALPTAPTIFGNGVAAYQKSDFNVARAAFQEVIRSEPQNSHALFNLGLIEQKSGKIGLALALWRKALAIQPGFEPAERAAKWATEKLERREISHDAQVWESFRSLVLTSISIDQCFVSVALFFFGAGWLLLRHFGAKRRARLDEQPSPPFPISGAIVAFALLIAIVITASKVWDMQTLRGTVIEKRVEARSSPDESATALFDLYEGLEVIVRSRTQDWAQVTYPGGSTGWIPSRTLLTLDDQVVM